MEEISRDLSISKSSLSYYFKYKELLILEVLKKLSSEYLKELNIITINEDRNFYEVIDDVVNLKGKFFRRNYTILTYFLIEIGRAPREIIRIWAEERRIYINFFYNRLVFNACKPLDSQKKSKVYYGYIQALYSQKLLIGDYMITRKDVLRISHNEMALSRIIIKGLS